LLVWLLSGLLPLVLAVGAYFLWEVVQQHAEKVPQGLLAAAVVFIFTMLCCAPTMIFNPVSSASPGPPLLGFALLLALLLAAATFLLICLFQGLISLGPQTAARYEALLTPALPNGERLLAFVKGHLGGDSGLQALFSSLGESDAVAALPRWYLIGLTPRHLVLVQVKGSRPTGVRQALRHNEVLGLSFRPDLAHGSCLTLQLRKEFIEFGLDPAMVKPATQFAAAWQSIVGASSTAQAPETSPYPERSAQEHVDRAQMYQCMGLPVSAADELDQARQANPGVVSDARYRELQAQDKQAQVSQAAWKTPMRVGGILFGIDTLMLVALWFGSLRFIINSDALWLGLLLIAGHREWLKLGL
jgi:hypothetical protein